MRRETYFPLVVLMVMIALVVACSQQATTESTEGYTQQTATESTEGYIIFHKYAEAGGWWSIEPDGSNLRKFDIPTASSILSASISMYEVHSNPGGSFVLFLLDEDSYVAEPDGSNPRPLRLPDGLDSSFDLWEWSPDGRQALAWSFNTPLYLVDLAAAQVKELTSRGREGSKFSPDGKWIAFYSENGVVLTGPKREDHRLATEKSGVIVGFSPESSELLCTHRGPDEYVLYIESLDGSDRRELTRKDRLRSLAVLPDQPVVLVTTGHDENTIEAIDLKTGSQRWVLQGLPPRPRFVGLSPNGKFFMLQYIDEEQATHLIIDVATGGVKELGKASGGTGYRVEFSPDGCLALIISSFGTSAYLADLETDRYTQLVHPSEALGIDSRDQPFLMVSDWAPDSNKLLFTMHEPKEEEETALLVDSNGDNLRELAGGAIARGLFSPDGRLIALSLLERVEGQEPDPVVRLVDVDTGESTLFIEHALLSLWIR